MRMIKLPHKDCGGVVWIKEHEDEFDFLCAKCGKKGGPGGQIFADGIAIYTVEEAAEMRKDYEGHLYIN